MTRSIEVEIDADREVHPVIPTERIPRGRATLTFEVPANPEALLSQDALAEDWLRPEEDDAWQHLQPAR